MISIYIIECSIAKSANTIDGISSEAFEQPPIEASGCLFFCKKSGVADQAMPWVIAL